jgi:hypothetical protein
MAARKRDIPVDVKMRFMPDSWMKPAAVWDVSAIAGSHQAKNKGERTQAFASQNKSKQLFLLRLAAF